MSPLPIDTILPELERLLACRHAAVLEAPPGAGKTTRVPLALLDAPWLAGRRIVMLEPRRLAARAAATFMATSLGEKVGGRVGYRVRMESRVGPRTRVEVVTEGVLVRMLQEDPSLEGVGLVIFDEFHERSLEADLGLALTLQARELFRQEDPLRLLVMSATLEGLDLAGVLAGASVVRSEGRSHPVEIRYQEPWRAGEDVTLRVARTITAALEEEEGSLLVFLPGQGEIRRTAQRLHLPGQVDLVPLHGALDLDAQQRAIRPSPPGRRKVVLATDIAETSLTIEGVRQVIDCGLARKPAFDPASGLTRLRTRRISLASATQRAGRAGRVEPGICHRLWSETQQAELMPSTPAEILQADLAPLALQLLRWGCDDPAELSWLDPPPPGAWQQGLELLRRLGAVERGPQGRLRLTAEGEAMACLPVHPRLAHMLLTGERLGLGDRAARLAALLSERDPLGGGHADLEARLAWLERAEEGAARRLLRQAERYRRGIGEGGVPGGGEGVEEAAATGFLLALAWPDRIAWRRDRSGILYRLAAGRGARLGEEDPLRGTEWLVVPELGGMEGQADDRIFLAAPLDPALFDGPLAHRVEESTRVGWDETGRRVVAERQWRVGRILLRRAPLETVPGDQACRLLLERIRREGLELLPWTPALRQWQARVAHLRRLHPDEGWPDLSDGALLEGLERWLASWLEGVNSVEGLRQLDLAAVLAARLSWPMRKRLDELLPERIQVPSGSRIAIDYTSDPPVMAVKLQEMFGCRETPAVAGGRLRLRLHLLSPARRPLQVTQDLAAFWENGYAEVRKEMRGRYPKHPWPEDPLMAVPTRHTRRRGK